MKAVLHKQCLLNGKALMTNHTELFYILLFAGGNAAFAARRIADFGGMRNADRKHELLGAGNQTQHVR